MGASAISKDRHITARSSTVKITILRPASPLPLSESAKLAQVLQIPSQLNSPIIEDSKGETDSIEGGTVDNIRHHARRKKILWQPTSPNPDSKVHYVNIAKAPPISPSSSSGAKSVHLTPSPSTTPSPIEPSIGTFSEASRRRTSSKSMHDFSDILDPDKLPLTYQPRTATQKAPLQHANTHYRLNVPKQTQPTGLLSPEQLMTSQPREEEAAFTGKTMKDREEGGRSTRGLIDLSSRQNRQFKRSTM